MPCPRIDIPIFRDTLNIINRLPVQASRSALLVECGIIARAPKALTDSVPLCSLLEISLRYWEQIVRLLTIPRFS
jgi:hypothetical protein